MQGNQSHTEATLAAVSGLNATGWSERPGWIPARPTLRLHPSTRLLRAASPRQLVGVSRRTLQLVTRHDHRLMQRVHRWPAPRWLRVWMVGATRAGDGGLWGVLGLLVLVFGGPGRGLALAAAALSSLCGIALFLSIKRVTRRRRPYDIQQHCWWRSRSRDPFSFPSGHTLTAFAVATPLLLFWPAFGLALIFCAVNIAASRILLGMHFLSDVVVGLLLGCGLGYASFLVLMR